MSLSMRRLKVADEGLVFDSTDFMGLILTYVFSSFS